MNAPRTSIVRAGIGAVCAGVVLVGAASPVLADSTPTPAPSAPGGTGAKLCTPDRIAKVQARVHLAVANRLVAIDRLTHALAQRPHVTDGHRATLSATYASDTAGLKAVDARVQADTTCQAAVADGHTVVTGFRVYLLLAPQTRLVAASDTGSYGAGRLAATEPKVQAAIDALTDPTTKAKAQVAFNDLKGKVTSAQADFAGVGDTVLALVPADIPAKQGTLDDARAHVHDGRTALVQAVADAKSLRHLLGP